MSLLRITAVEREKLVLIIPIRILLSVVRIDDLRLGKTQCSDWNKASDFPNPHTVRSRCHCPFLFLEMIMRISPLVTVAFFSRPIKYNFALVAQNSRADLSAYLSVVLRIGCAIMYVAH